MAAGFRDLTTGILFGQQRHHASVDARLADFEQLLATFTSQPSSQGSKRTESAALTAFEVPVQNSPAGAPTTSDVHAVSSSAMSVTNADRILSVTHGVHPLATELSSASTSKVHDITFDFSMADMVCTPPSPTGNSTALKPNHALLKAASASVPRLQPSALALAPANSYMTALGDPVLVQQLEQQRGLINELGEAQFYLHRPWKWFDSQLVPSYSFQPVRTVADLWTEWTAGLNGCMSLSLLVNRWSTKWRKGDNAKRTEFSRRKKVIDLIERLRNKHRWDVALALRFLQEKYGNQTASKFSKYLSSNGGQSDEVFAAAQSYP